MRASRRLLGEVTAQAIKLPDTINVSGGYGGGGGTPGRGGGAMEV